METKSVLPEEFDWETADWMPTPPGQALIPVPWTGQGSLNAFYGLDVVNDYKRVDGWRLVYSSFRHSGEELIDPYFMLYNVYRGTLRIYFYITTPYIGTSTYLQDSMSISATNGASSTILNYLGEISDPSNVITSFKQIQPKMLDGGAPLAGRRWYMMQYEMAYDPSLSQKSADDIQLCWGLNYYQVDSVSFITDAPPSANIYCPAGASNNGLQDAFTSFKKGALSILGLSMMNSLSINTDTGANVAGIKNYIFKSLYSGATSAVSSFASGVPTIAYNLLNVVFGGNSSLSDSKTMSLKFDSPIKFVGSSSSQGSVSSTPITFRIPGTIINQSASGYLPLYNEPLGVIHWDSNAVMNLLKTDTVTYEEDDIRFSGIYQVTKTEVTCQDDNYNNYISFNPAVTEIADVSVESWHPFVIDTSGDMHYFPLNAAYFVNPYEGSYELPDIDKYCVRVTVKVTPHNGAPSSYIIKTFNINNINSSYVRNEIK